MIYNKNEIIGMLLDSNDDMTGLSYEIPQRIIDKVLAKKEVRRKEMLSYNDSKIIKMFYKSTGKKIKIFYNGIYFMPIEIIKYSFQLN